MNRDRFRFFRTYQLYLAWVIAVIGMLGSLFLSEVMQLEPCKLCWFQRICLYPLAIFLGMAAYKNDRGILPYARTLSAVGSVIALWQYLEQKVPALHAVLPCTVGVPCSHQYFNGLGFITIPFMSLIGFLLITLLLSLRGAESRSDD